MTEPREFASLQGRVALVTGGSRGIGAAIARELARAGAGVALNYRSNQAAADEIAAEIGGIAVQGDVASVGDTEVLIERVES